jgi:hypothetical protein
MKNLKENYPQLIVLILSLFLLIAAIIFATVFSKPTNNQQPGTVTETGKIKIKDDQGNQVFYPANSITASPSRIRGQFKPGQKMIDLIITNTIKEDVVFKLEFVERGGQKSSRVNVGGKIFTLDGLSQISVPIGLASGQISPNLVGQLNIKARPLLTEQEKETITLKKGKIVFDPIFNIALPVEVQVLGQTITEDFQVSQPELKRTDLGDFEPVVPIKNDGDILLDISGQFILKQDGVVVNKSFLNLDQPALPDTENKIGSQSTWSLFPGKYLLTSKIKINEQIITKTSNITVSDNSKVSLNEVPDFEANLAIRSQNPKANRPLSVEYSILNTGRKAIEPKLIIRVVEIVNQKDKVLSKIEEKTIKVKPGNQLLGATVFNNLGLTNQGRYFIKAKIIHNKKELSTNSQLIVFDEPVVIKSNDSNGLLWLFVGFFLPLAILLAALLLFYKQDKKKKNKIN